MSASSETAGKLPPELTARVERLIGETVSGFSPASGGYSLAVRGRVRFASGRAVFVKAAVSDDTATWLRTEARLYQGLGPRPFLARFVAFDDHADSPLLILEDLSAAHWPPPWRAGDVERVRAMLADIHTTPAPAWLPTLESHRDSLSSWTRVAADPGAFLSLGFCGGGWLERALPALLAAETALHLAGDSLVHVDVRSDNLCLTADNRAVLVDWNWACAGNPTLDIAGWLPSLRSEGGPAPETILPDAPSEAAALAGYFGARAGLPPPPGAPTVRAVQISQLATALPWAARALRLPPPDGAALDVYLNLSAHPKAGGRY